MKENIIFNDAKIAIMNFFKNEFQEFDSKLMARFLNYFVEISTCEEEGVKISPNILITNNIDSIVKHVPAAYKLALFNDTDETMFNSRMKSLVTFCNIDWTIYVNIKPGEYSYGLCKALNSIKDADLKSLIFSSSELKDRSERLSIINVRPNNNYSIRLNSLKGDELNISFALDNKTVLNLDDEIVEFVDASFSKLRTTQAKLKEIKTLYKNIFNNVFKNVNGAICVVIDKDYVDNGFLSDGIWLEEPISFSKLFLQSKSYNESKLMAFSDLFVAMLNYDGITIVDNAGRIRAYNVFIETNHSKVGKVIGGARKRAAYTVINSRRKRIIGVYFQSHEGEVFYESVKK